MNRPAICSTESITAFLNGQLNAGEEAEFEQHLDRCADCRDQLQEQAADPTLWRDVRGLSVHDVDRIQEPDAADGTFTTCGSAPPRLDFLAATDDPHMLGRFAGYEVAAVIGCGGMGIVLKGFDRSLNRFVAIKVLAPHYATSGAARRRFEREAQAAAAVVHDHVIAIHGVAECDGLPYLVMPYVRGESLQRRLDRSGPLSVPEILRIGFQTARGLAAAHEQGLVHRDIKPGNILLPAGVERVMITDFGLARAADDASLTRSGVIAGTPQYMSPEQARGEPVDARSDLFSLGSVMYALCTGRPPFRADTAYGILRRITDDNVRPIREVNPDIPPWLSAITRRLLSKSADDRFESAECVAVLLEECLAHVQQPDVVPLPRSIEAPVVTRGASLRYGIALTCVAAVVAAGWWLLPLGLMPAPNEPAADLPPEPTSAVTVDSSVSQRVRDTDPFVWREDRRLDDLERTLSELRLELTDE